MSYDSESGEDLVRELPAIFPRDDSSDNYKLFQVVGHEVDKTKDDVDAIDRATTVQHADTVAQLEALADLVDLEPRAGETREKYRSRVIGRYQLVTSEGNISDIINSVAVILGANPNKIGYEELSQDFQIAIKVPKSKLNDLELSNSELAEIIRDLGAASLGVEAQIRGTFEYVTPSTYQDIQDGNDSWSNYPGYDGLDSDGNKKNNPDAGTYAGTLE